MQIESAETDPISIRGDLYYRYEMYVLQVYCIPRCIDGLPTLMETSTEVILEKNLIKKVNHYTSLLCVLWLAFTMLKN